MSANRILKKRKQQAEAQSFTHLPSQQGSNPSQFPAEHSQMSKHEAKLEQQFEPYIEYLQYNPSFYQFSNSYLPYNASLYSKFKMPISLFIPCVAYDSAPVERSIDKIPRCGICRAYMNYYNKVQNKSFTCFVCGKQNVFDNYVIDPQNIEICQPSYHVLGGQKFYEKPPPQHTIAFLIDMNTISFQSKMLYYFVTVAKEVLSRQQFNETQIYFYTYDEVIHEYDFSGEEVKCIVFDPSIKSTQGKVQETFLQNIREKLFGLLDSLQQMAQNNRKQGSNFFQAINYVIEAVKNVGAKILVFQTNQAIVGQQFAIENLKDGKQIEVERPPRSFLQTKNKALFNKFAKLCTDLGISFSFFIFERNFKNVRVFGDLAKITNSEIFLYRKDSHEDLMKFYYDLYYVLGTPYYSDVRMDFIISPGWYFTAIYGNIYRIKEHITFKICHYEPSKKICVTFLPQQSTTLPYCAIQVVTNYIYNRQHFVTVNTSVLPLTTSLDKLFANQNYPQSAATLQRTFLSGLRLEEVNVFRNKTIKGLAQTWKIVNEFYKKKVTPQITNLFLSQLGILKSPHFQLDSINDSIILDMVVAQRNFLQSCGVNELQGFFCPYLFNLTTMTKEMCLDDENFIYPEVCELKFSSVREGMYLLDNGLSLYLYVSKVCDPIYLKMLFGKDKFSKSEQVSEETFRNDNLFAQQVSNLIRVCRQQKSYGWVPLYMVRCGQNSLNQKIFYMNFYAQKYDQFRSFKFTLNEFLTMLSQQY